MKHIKLYEEFHGDEPQDEQGTTKITIEKVYNDERAPERETTYSVNYQYELSGNEIEITGTISPYETGRLDSEPK